MKETGKLVGIAILVSCLIFLVVAPFSGIRTLSYYYFLVKYIVMALSFNLIAGYVGYISFGHIVFFGIGGYAAAILTLKTGLGAYFYLPLMTGALGAAAAAALIGIPLLRLRGAYFAIATIAFNEALRVIILNVPDRWGGGSFGIPLVRILNPWVGYYAMLATAAIAFGVTYLIVKSRYGVILRAIREDEDAAMVMGINAPKYKVIVFALSALLMGIAGGIDLWASGYIYPESAFRIDTNVEVIAMTMLGGSGTLIGPLLGVAILYIIEDYVWLSLPFLHLVILGLIIGTIVLFMPRGILGALEEKIPALRGKIK